nr:hypothetical protein [Tanacetum cinerariifolium]
MKGSCKSLVELEFFLEEVYKATTDQLDWNNPEVTKTKAAYYGDIKWIEDLVNRESARDVYSKRRIIAITELQIVEWHNYKHLDWITIRKDDDKLYKFKEGDFKRLRIQDNEDMLLLLVQGKLTNLTIDERLAFNVSLRMFTRSIVIQRHVEDLQLGVERSISQSWIRTNQILNEIKLIQHTPIPEDSSTRKRQPEQIDAH